MKKIQLLALVLPLALSVSVLVGSNVPVSLAQQGQQASRSPGHSPGGCYVCGKLNIPMSVIFDGSDWWGILAEDACPIKDYSEKHPEKVMSLCEKIKAEIIKATGKFTSFKDSCPVFAPYCDGEKKNSPNGKNCGDNMPENGALFAWGTTVPVANIYSEASTDSKIIGTQPNGTRVVYNQTTRTNGQTWYYVHPPGRPAGWMRGEPSCTRPGNPPNPRSSGPVLYDDGTTPRPTAAIVAGARG